MKDNYIEANELLMEEGLAEEVNGKEPKFRRPKRIFQKRKMRIILLILAIILLAGAATLLCFKLFEPEEVYDDSAAFYFSSDFLSEEGGEFTVYDSIEFNVYNYADSLRVSKEPLESFEVKVEADGKDITGKAEISTGETLMTPDVRSGCTVAIELPEEYYDKKVDVSVTSSPIEKKLTGSFIIKPEWGYEIKDEEGNVCAELVIYANKDVSLTVKWDSEALIADSTDSYVKAAGNEAKSFKVELVGGTSVSIPMFKVDVSEDFSSDEKVIKVTKSKNEPEEKEETAQSVESETEEVAA